MSRFVSARKLDLDLAKAIDACFKPAPLVNIAKARAPRKTSKAQQAKAALEVLLEAPGTGLISAFLYSGGVCLLKASRLPRETRYRFICEAALGQDLSLRLELGGSTYNLELPRLPESGGELRISHWAQGAPPRVMLGGAQINRGAGAHLVQIGELPPLPQRSTRLVLKQAGLGLQERPEGVRIFIDGKLAEQPRGGDLDDAQVYHTEEVALGLHRIVVVSKRRGWTILDTDVVANGVDVPLVEWARPSFADAEARVKFGGREAFLGKRPAFVEAASTVAYGIQAYSIGGIEIPDGLGPHEGQIEHDKRFAEAMVRNYRRFLDLLDSAKKKQARGQRLTPEEAEVVGLDSYAKLQEWVDARKRAEGFNPSRGGHTTLEGDIESDRPEPQDAYDELQERITLGVHEPSHVEGKKRYAASLGLDWERLRAYIRASRRRSDLWKKGLSDEQVDAELTQEEKDVLAWGRGFLREILAYITRSNHLEIMAPEEIQEYEAEIQFYTELLAILRKEREEHSIVPDGELWRSAHYLFGIRDSFAGLPDAEKERLRSRLRSLRRSAQVSDTLSDEQKAHLLMMIDEAMAALG